MSAEILPTSEPGPESRSLGLGWWFLLGLLILLPSSTGAEQIVFSAGGLDLNLRFAVYAGAAVVMALAALPVALRAIRGSWPRIVIPAALLAWLLITTLLAGQPPREWLPTVVRWVLYLSVLLVADAVGRGGRPGRAAQVRTAIALGLVVPMVGGLWELVSGTAPLLNNAPRISSVTLGHPVAFSLILMTGLFVVLPVAITTARSPRPLGLMAALAVVAALAEIMLTYTRLTLVLALVGCVAIATALQPHRRFRAALASSAVALLALVIAGPLLISRFEQPVTWPAPTPSAATADGSGAAPSAGQPTAAPTPTATPRLVVIDNSTKLRIEIHQRGIGYVASSPLVGHGPGSFDRLYEADTGRVGVAAHDDVLLFAVELGLPGLALVLLLYATVLVPLLPALAGSRTSDGFTVSALVAFGLLNLGAVIHNPTYFPEVEVAAWALVGLAGATAPPVRSWLPGLLGRGRAGLRRTDVRREP